MALAKPTGSGIVLRVNDPGLAVQRLYAERRKCGDPALAVLQFRRQGNDAVWIVRGNNDTGRSEESS